eukprot:CAMPEP_0194043270 /NCGR_PEP_ID=MMETSP0009_2-20130614/14939_1 /TAXON_ID=210454 /ORGANISM="Grammatophora oceanica, Strain CCMP 410" /LENGTH=206 /DNA_ID=CAMNT_0038687421 /DNA_START=624 /DNA_END=1244 /DNA_ORIENTATION=-
MWAIKRSQVRFRQPPNSSIYFLAADETLDKETDILVTGLIESPAGADEVDGGSSAADGAEIIKAWRSIYTTSSSDDDKTSSQFWAAYDPIATSIWTMVYDEADSNESLEETMDIVSNYMNQDGMKSIKHECFGVIHVLDSLEIEGLWLFRGPDPERMFGANEESSWYTWSRLGPEATDPVKEAVAKVLLPKYGKLKDKTIKGTKVF